MSSLFVPDSVARNEGGIGVLGNAVPLDFEVAAWCDDADPFRFLAAYLVQQLSVYEQLQERSALGLAREFRVHDAVPAALVIPKKNVRRSTPKVALEASLRDHVDTIGYGLARSRDCLGRPAIQRGRSDAADLRLWRG